MANTAEELIIEQLSNVCKVLSLAEERVPDNMKLTDAKYKSKDILENGTELIKNVDKCGVILANDDIEDFIAYFNKYITNKDVKNVSVSLYCHSNEKRLNTINGCCMIDDTDFAEIRVITPDKTILIYCNKIDSKSRKIGNFVKVFNTSWKKLKSKQDYKSTDEFLIDRVLITSAIHMKMNVETKEKFRALFEDYVDYSGAKLIRIFNDENSKKVNLTERKDLANILKTVYSRLIDGKLRRCGSGAFNDCTIVDFEYKEYIISFSLDFCNVTMQLI